LLQKPSQLIFFPLGLHRRTRDLAEVAVPPPSGAGHRRGMGDPLDSPVTCAYASATRRAHQRTFWSTAARSRVAPVSPPPRAAALRRARRRPSLVCVQSPWILHGRLRSHTPSRLRGGPRRTRAGSRWIQDPRCGSGDLVKEPLSKFVLTCRSFHL
jgi:hypothetical protein